MALARGYAIARHRLALVLLVCSCAVSTVYITRNCVCKKTMPPTICVPLKIQEKLLKNV